VHQNECSVALFWIGALRTQAVKRRKRRLLQRRNVAFQMISKQLSLGSAHEVPKSETKGSGQRIGDLNPTFTLPNSTELIVVRCTLARSAKSSCESLSFPRAKRIAFPKVSRENLVAFATPYF
jgi:hypothetical protein